MVQFYISFFFFLMFSSIARRITLEYVGREVEASLMDPGVTGDAPAC